MLVKSTSSRQSFNPSKEILRKKLSILGGGVMLMLLKCFQIRFWYVRSLPKLYISGFNIGRKDFSERVKINDLLDDIRDRVWELLK